MVLLRIAPSTVTPNYLQSECGLSARRNPGINGALGNYWDVTLINIVTFLARAQSHVLSELQYRQVSIFYYMLDDITCLML
jgi:hypothetical protein